MEAARPVTRALFAAVSIFAALMPASADSLPLDFGGVTYDFAAISAKFAANGSKPVKDRISIRNAIPDSLDGVFALPQGQVGIYIFEWRGNGGEQLEAERLRVELKLPPSIELLDCNFSSLAQGRRRIMKDGSVLWTLEIRRGMGRFFPDVPPLDGFGRSSPFQLLLAPKAGRGDAGEGAISISYCGKRASNVERVRFHIVESIRVRAPKRMWSGVFPGQCIFDFRSEGAFAKLARFMADAGMRWMIWPKWQSPEGCDERALPILRQSGFIYLTPHDCSLCDGYQVGPGYVRPQNERFETEAKGVWYDGAICPVAVYSRMPYFMEYAEKGLSEILKGADGAWANWEPYPACANGCWCGKCRDAFIEYSGLEKRIVEAAWPQEMKRDGRYAEIYIAFRAKEFAKVVKAVDGWVRKYTGGEKSQGFNPGVAWCEMSSKWRDDIDAGVGHRYCREQSTREYSGSLKWIEPWGPYARWETKKPYVYSKERYLNYFIAAKDVREQLDRDYPGGGKPMLMGFPSGMQADVWVSQPEELAMAFDAYYFNGWRAVVPYSFPRGYDARYWRAVASATERAAKYEDWILDGERVDGDVAIECVAPFAAPCALVTPYVPAATNVSLLQTAAYRLKDVTAVAVFNYWQNGAAFFNLRVKGLKAGLYEVVDESGVRFAKSSADAYWSADELARGGVGLMTGAVRTRVFEVRPVGVSYSRPVRASVLPHQLRKAMQERWPQLKKQADKDKEVEDDRRKKRWVPEAI